MKSVLSFNGLDGANPLGFMALLGVALMSSQFCRSAKFYWQLQNGGWHPQLEGFQGSESEFLDLLFGTLKATSHQPFQINRKFPFSRNVLRAAMEESQSTATPSDRRIVDLLAAFGSDAHADKEGIFLDSALRMVRSGDSNGQGLSVYAISIRENLTIHDLRATLFSTWHYEDDDFSLRWSPLEDQRYALRWYDPSPPTNKRYGLRTMRGANALALEGLGLLPVQPQLHGISTTGFSNHRRQRQILDFFVWPIWDAPVSFNIIRSLLTLPELMQQPLPRDDLLRRGIVEVYRCQRISASKYYKNFTPAQPA